MELLGTDSYPSWRWAIRLALAGKGLWNHCCSGTNLINIAEYVSAMPQPTTAGSPTPDELKLMKEWIKEDAQAKALISQKLSPIVQNMLNESLTAREQWDILTKRFAHLDVTSQFKLHLQFFTERLKDAEDASRYLSIFKNGHRHFTEIPGSEYTNVVNGMSSDCKLNPSTGVHIHKHNPKGVPCDNPQGGSMEGKGPWLQKGGDKPKRDLTAAASEDKASSNAAPSSNTTQTSAAATETDHHRNLSFAIIEDLTEEDFSHLATQYLSTILDLDTTSHLIMEQEAFWMYHDSSITIKTANHGKLTTFGHDCLHAPGAFINLFSIACMVKKGWECNFKPYPSHCELVRQGVTLGAIPVTGYLYLLDLKFFHPNKANPLSASPPKISAFACMALSWDLWHACLGHIRGDAVKRVPLIATGVKVESEAPLQCCEPCIMAKHPHKPFVPSDELHTTHPLSLIHSNLCGPFPIMTPHCKHHFIIFLDNNTNLLNLQLLAMKYQALEAWHTVKNCWENHTE
ncbi:hypothetical protein DFH29DRAFT_1004740 [Suillus ampliporus]|nr:hypothetical protein DFH29DRAFT_1004740 [Suillus ampliporus]